MNLDPNGFKVYALCTVILFLKMFAVGIVQGLTRQRHKAFTLPEDARMIVQTEAVTTEHPAVMRANNAYRNDLENIPLFLVLALIYQGLQCWPGGAPVYFVLFTLGRIGHTYSYLKALQPWRSLAYFVGLLVNFALCGHIVYQVLTT
jgi:uncharacterized MAPEG superfamily protein